MTSLVFLSGCGPAMDSPKPLWEAGETRNKIVVISDIHLGIDDAYSETKNNIPQLIKFLQQIQVTTDVRELVIDGDFLDEWFLPVYFPSYSDSTQFYRDCVTNNQDVIDEFKNVIKSGIKLVYVIGNHDMLMESSVLAEAIPGIVQVTDAKGIGAYYTGDRNEIVIEHGHRYDPFSAPDTVTNAELCGNDDTILPSGYFYARYGATWVAEEKPTVHKDLPVISNIPDESDVDQYGAFLYYQILTSILGHVTPNEQLDAKIFKMHIAGFNDHYSFLDFYPIQGEDNTISATVLFKNIQRTWEQRQQINKVNVPNTFIEAAGGALTSKYFSDQAKIQYLNNPDENVDVVVFGHTHKPRYETFENDKYYVNTGTWIDDNANFEEATRIFTVIETGENDTVSLYKYNDGLVEDFSLKPGVSD